MVVSNLAQLSIGLRDYRLHCLQTPVSKFADINDKALSYMFRPDGRYSHQTALLHVDSAIIEPDDGASRRFMGRFIGFQQEFLALTLD